MPDISIRTIKSFALEAQGIYKVIKGGGVAAGGGALAVGLMQFVPEAISTPETGVILGALCSIGINFLRKILLKYDIKVTGSQ
jgi:hypothetical protein